MTGQSTDTYGFQLRRGMRAKNMTRRDLEKALKDRGRGYSYEHIRKVTAGLPVMSEQFNQDVCRVLGLDEDDLWRIAAREKLTSSTRTSRLLITAAPDPSLIEAWAELTDSDRQSVSRIIEGLAEQRRREQAARNTDDPEQIRDQIIQLMQRLPPSALWGLSRRQKPHDKA